VRAVIGQKIGIASTNELSDDALAGVAAKAYEIAGHQRENEDFRSLPRPSAAPSVDAWSDGTARCGPEERAAVVAHVCDASSRAGLTAAGAFHTTAHEIALANSRMWPASTAKTSAARPSTARYGASSRARSSPATTK
jgi:predicted Zn-dependent protease